MDMLPSRSTNDPVAAFSVDMASQVFGNKVGTVGHGVDVASRHRVSTPSFVLSGAERDASGQLRQHINSCRRSAGPLHHAHCFVELMYDTVATRLVTTTVVLLAGMVAISALV